MTTKQPTERQQHWLTHIQACDKTALSYRAYADQHGFSPRALYGAKKELVQGGFLSRQTKSRFQRVKIKPTVSPLPSTNPVSVSTHCTITLPNGICLKWPVSGDSDSLTAILAAVTSS